MNKTISPALLFTLATMNLLFGSILLSSIIIWFQDNGKVADVLSFVLAGHYAIAIWFITWGMKLNRKEMNNG